MRSDFITKPLPKSVLIDGVTYPVNCDFRIGIQFENVRKGKGSDAEKLIRLLRLYYPVRIPPDIGKALDRIIWFYRCGEEKEKEEKKERYQRRGSKDPAYSFSQDAPYIYAAFKEQYGIDLTKEDLHWWKFMALFESLGEDTKMSRIMYYRKVSTSGMSKSERAFINDMKKLYKIRDDGEEKLSLEERNRKWREYIGQRQKEAKQSEVAG